MAKKKQLDKIKKKHPICFLVVIFVIVAMAVGGFFTCKMLTKNDKFEIIGEKNIVISVGDVYEDRGAIAISFGKDISSKIKVESNVDVKTAGEYFIKYSIKDDLIYKNIVRYRYVLVLEAGNE